MQPPRPTEGEAPVRTTASARRQGEPTQQGAAQGAAQGGRVQRHEWLRCRASPAYFLDTYAQVYDATSLGWLRFRLWPAQMGVLAALRRERLVVVLKARQLGLSWLTAGYALWLMLFQPAATVLIFSKRDAEAVHLLSFRLRGMYRLLPPWLQCRAVLRDAAHELRLSNGSAALAFPTTGGRGYTASLALVDEADHADDLDALLNAVKPTVDAGGRLVLLSTVDKSRPESAFKRIYRAASEGRNGYAAVFLPWSARPDRSAAWYAEQERDMLARTGSRDDLYQEYPATDVEALAGRSTDKRFAVEWLARCDGATPPPTPPLCAGEGGMGVGEWENGGVGEETGRQGASRQGGDEGEGFSHSPTLPLSHSLPGLAVFRPPLPGHSYAIGADPAEGNPRSDESAASVIEVTTGEQVAALAGRFDPTVFAGHLAGLSERFNGAPVLVERNNHGHAVLLWLKEFSSVECLPGLDGKAGWLESGRSKPLAFDWAADVLRDGGTTIHDRETLLQLAGIEGSTLRAPSGQHDDRALAHVLALAALRWGLAGTGESVIIEPTDVIWEADQGGW